MFYKFWFPSAEAIFDRTFHGRVNAKFTNIASFGGCAGVSSAGIINSVIALLHVMELF